MARPSKYTPEIASRICKRIAEGESLRAICRDADLPSAETVRVWLLGDEAFSAQYTRAREEQADFYADEIIDIADTDEDPQRAKVRIDARKWKASRMAPKKWGDKIQTEVSGPDGKELNLWGSGPKASE